MRCEDGGRLLRALEDAGVGAGDLRGVQPLEPATTNALWDTFVACTRHGARHGMLLPRDAWPNAERGASLSLPLPLTYSSALLWIVFWMRERSAVVRGVDLEASLDELLMIDDEALIALNTDTLDTLQSWGGHGEWRTMRRPA